MPKQPTAAQSAASRANGARSRGPKTAAGLERCRNSTVRHGLRGAFALLPGEDPAAFAALRAAWARRFAHDGPETPARAATLDAFVQAIWRAARLDALEERVLTALLEGRRPVLSLATLCRYRARVAAERAAALAALQVRHDGPEPATPPPARPVRQARVHDAPEPSTAGAAAASPRPVHDGPERIPSRLAGAASCALLVGALPQAERIARWPRWSLEEQFLERGAALLAAQPLRVLPSAGEGGVDGERGLEGLERAPVLAAAHQDQPEPRERAEMAWLERERALDVAHRGDILAQEPEQRRPLVPALGEVRCQGHERIEGGARGPVVAVGHGHRADLEQGPGLRVRGLAPDRPDLLLDRAGFDRIGGPGSWANRRFSRGSF